MEVSHGLATHNSIRFNYSTDSHLSPHLTPQRHKVTIQLNWKGDWFDFAALYAALYYFTAKLSYSQEENPHLSHERTSVVTDRRRDLKVVRKMTVTNHKEYYSVGQLTYCRLNSLFRTLWQFLFTYLTSSAVYFTAVCSFYTTKMDSFRSRFYFLRVRIKR